jgi:hypothetical protein
VVYTDDVLIDESAPFSHSHPVLTLGPRHVLDVPPDLALTVFLHEQMHWAYNVLPGCREATAAVQARWPDPPSHNEGGAGDANSTWLHFPVCALEIAATSLVIGPERALDAVRRVPWYRWIYDRLLDELPYAEYLASFGIELPDVPPTRVPPLVALRGLPAGPVGRLMNPIEGHLHQWAQGVDPVELRDALGNALDPWRDLSLPPELLARIVAATVVAFVAMERLGGRDEAIAAGATSVMNADVYAAIGANADALASRLTGLNNDSGAIVDWARYG